MPAVPAARPDGGASGDLTLAEAPEIACGVRPTARRPARRGRVRAAAQGASSSASHAARSPSATTATRPSVRLRAEPTRPSSSARDRVHQRKPTPWTKPCTQAVSRTVTGRRTPVLRAGVCAPRSRCSQSRDGTRSAGRDRSDVRDDGTLRPGGGPDQRPTLDPGKEVGRCRWWTTRSTSTAAAAGAAVPRHRLRRAAHLPDDGRSFAWIGMLRPGRGRDRRRRAASSTCTSWPSRTRSTSTSARSWSATATRSSSCCGPPATSTPSR